MVATVGNAVLGLFAGTVTGVIMESMGFDIEAIRRVATIAGFIVGMPVSFFAFRWAAKSYILPAMTPTLLPSESQEPVNVPSVPPVEPYRPPTRE